MFSGQVVHVFRSLPWFNDLDEFGWIPPERYADGDNDEGEIGVSRANADISTLLNVRKPSSLPPGWSLGCHAEISDF